MVLKYTSPRRMGRHADGEYPEPIFFEPNNERVGAKTYEEAEPRNDDWRCEPFSDSWSMKNNPERKKVVKGMPTGPRYNFYTKRYVTMASPEEAAAYYKLKLLAASEIRVDNTDPL